MSTNFRAVDLSNPVDKKVVSSSVNKINERAEAAGVSIFVSADNAKEIDTNSSSYKAAEIEVKIDELNQKKDDNLAEIDKLNSEIDKLTKEADSLEKKAKEAEQEAQRKLDEADKKEREASKKAVNTENAYKKESDAIVAAEIEKYNNSKGTISKDELSANISSALGDIDLSDVQNASIEAANLRSEAASLKADAASYRADASRIRGQIDIKQADIDDLVKDNKDIDKQIKDLQDEHENINNNGKSCQNESHGSNSSCANDPIGFEFDGKTYDFIRDDGNFDSVDDFLGSKNQWQEMQQLDTNSDGRVDVNEFKQANIKLTNYKGEVNDVDKLFGSDFSVDLNSYDKNGTYNIDKNDDDGDGISNQSLLGTFNVNIKGQDVKGYNTLDDTNWLSNKFGISNESNSNAKLTSNPFDLTFDNNTDLPKTTQNNKVSSNIDSDINNVEQELENYRKSLISNPFNATGESEIQPSDDNKNEQKKNLLFEIFKF